MARITLLLLLLPIAGFAQRDEWDNAFIAFLTSHPGKEIKLPEQGYYPNYNLEDIAPYYCKVRIMVVDNDVLYKKIFGLYRFTEDSLKKYKKTSDNYYYDWMVKHMRDSLPVIDFKKYQLLLYSACAQCLAFCEHKGKQYENCHRNRCNFSHKWFLKAIED